MNIVSSKPTITRKELEGVLDCLIHDELITGSTVKNFEGTLSTLTGIKFSAAVNSHTSAYHLAYKSLDIGPEDEIIMPAYFFNAALNALHMTGGKAVLVDSRDSSFYPSSDDIKSKITEKTRAIVIGHMCGMIEDFEGLKGLNLPIIEDISHGLGGEIAEKPIGGVGSIVVCSFTPFDIITTGLGGAVLTTNPRHYSVIKDLRFSKEKLHYDYKMTDFQAAMGISQISRLQDFITRRKDIARQYYNWIRHTSHKPVVPMNESFLYQSFPVIFDVPSDKVESYWKKNAIQIFKPVKVPLHHLLGIQGLEFPNAERLGRKVYSLPIYPTLSGKEIEKIGRTLAKFV